GEGRADSPAVRGQYARHAKEVAGIRGANVRRADDGPRGSVPALDQRLQGAAIVVVANCPAVRRGRAGNAAKRIAQRGAGVGRTDDGPRGSVPTLDQRLQGAAI